MYFTATEYDHMMIKRTRWTRMRSGLSQERIAKILMLPGPTYRNYEYRSPLPPRNLVRFCELVNIKVTDLVDPSLTKFDIELLKWHDLTQNCRLLRDDMRPNFVNGKLVPVGLQGKE